MDKEPPDGPFARLIRHRGPILPFCEVVHVVHPYTAFHLLNAKPPPELANEGWERIRRAVQGKDVGGSFLLLRCFYRYSLSS